MKRKSLQKKIYKTMEVSYCLLFEVSPFILLTRLPCSVHAVFLNTPNLKGIFPLNRHKGTWTKTHEKLRNDRIFFDFHANLHVNIEYMPLKSRKKVPSCGPS